MNREKMIKKIASFHKGYVNSILKKREEDKEKYKSSLIDSLFYIFSFSFFRGRNDKLSKKFKERAINAINELNKDHSIEELIMNKKKKFVKKANSLISKKDYKLVFKRLKEEEVNNKYDRLMVVSLIDFYRTIDENIVNYMILKIRNGELSNLSDELEKVLYIGDKISSLILRDTVIIYDLKKYLKPDDYIYLQPIDTWVFQVAKEIGMINEEKIKKCHPEQIVKKCQEFSIDPIEFNQGAWYIGANPLNIIDKLTFY